MKTLVIAEHDNQSLAAASLPTLGCATKLGGEIHMAVIGYECNAAAKAAAACEHVAKVRYISAPHLAEPLAEEHCAALATLAGEYTHLLFAATTTGKGLAPRLGALLDVSPISEVTQVVSEDTFIRPIYAGNAFARVQSTSRIKILTVRGTAFEPVATQGGSAVIEQLDATAEVGLSSLRGRDLTSSDRPELASAKIVVSGGRGLGSQENFSIINQLAEKLGAAVGASRAAVDSGFVPNDYQVGQTGKIVAPQLYIAVGISGAIQHLAGMKESKVIVAINKDEEAPIMGVADYALVGDLFELVPELIAALE